MRGQLHAQAALPPGKEPPSTNLIGGRVGHRTDLDGVERRKILSLAGLELLPLGSPGVASRYTDWAIPAPFRVFINRSFTSGSPAEQSTNQPPN
jgi:hypothetical protein